MPTLVTVMELGTEVLRLISLVLCPPSLLFFVFTVQLSLLPLNS